MPDAKPYDGRMSGQSDRGDAAPKFRSAYFHARDGLRLHYRDYPGSDAVPPLLCLPGLTRNARDFETLAERIAPRFRVLAPDTRGRALSDRDPDPSHYHPLTYANDAIDLLDALSLPRAIFIGTSLGGLVTMLVARLAPERIAGAVLNDVGPELDTAGIDRIRGYLGTDARFATWDEAARQIAANNRGLPAHYTDAHWLRMARRICREDGGQVRFDYDMAIAQPFKSANASPPVDMWPMFRTLAQAPLLILRGERSDLLSAAALDRMCAEAPAATCVTVPGVGHAPDLEEPEAVAALDRFLRRFAS